MPKMQPDDGGTSTRRERDSFLPDSADVAQGLSGPPFIHITAWLDREPEFDFEGIAPWLVKAICERVAALADDMAEADLEVEADEAVVDGEEEEE